MIGPLDEDERPWRCSCGRTANIATRTCRRIQRKRASVAMSARFVRIALRANSAMSARTAAADLPRGRSDQRGNGVPACRLRNDRLRTSACISNMALMKSPRMPRASSIFRPRSGELSASFRRNDRPLDLTKADAIAIALTPAVKAEGVAVFEKRPLDIAGQFNRLGAVP